MKRLSFFLVFIVFLSSCETEKTFSPQDNTKKYPKLSIGKFSLTATNSGKTEWVFTAATAEVHDQRDTVEAKDIEVEFFLKKKENTVASHLKAGEGVVNTRTNDMEAFGDVVMVSENGNKLYTQKLKWISQSQKICTDEKVRIEKGDNVLTGVGMEADQRLDDVKILKEVAVEAKK